MIEQLPGQKPGFFAGGGIKGRQEDAFDFGVYNPVDQCLLNVTQPICRLF
jgi:hypothetical protein